MVSVSLAFFFFAIVILLGFATHRIFQATRFPDIPILLSIGLVLGPLNRTALQSGNGSQFIDRNLNVETLKEFAPFISSLALIVILFDSGLKLDFTQFRNSMRPAFAHTLPLFAVTVLSTSLIAFYVFGMPPILAVVLGVALSNVGQTVSAAIIREIKLDAEVRSIYFIEMAIYDLISIPLLVSLLEFAQGGAGVNDLGVFAQSLARVISISVVLGLGGGLTWIYVMLQLERSPYSYMVTLAGLLLVYSVNAFLGGSGPVSVLIFGLVIGNRATVLTMLHKPRLQVLEGERVHTFHDEITFFVRAFFFVFLGVTFTTGAPGESALESRLAPLSFLSGTAGLFLLGVALLFCAILATRYAVVRWISAARHENRMRLFPVYGRGLGTAVLATFPFTIAAYDTHAPEPSAYTQLLAPWEPIFLNTALLIILLTVMGTGLAVWLQERRLRDDTRTDKPPRAGEA